MQLGVIRAPGFPKDQHWQQDIADSLETGLLADKLGVSKAYFDLTGSAETSALNPSTMLLVKLAEETDNMQIGTNMPALGPGSVSTMAQTISYLDQLSNGRLFLGRTPPCNATKSVQETVEAALQVWRADHKTPHHHRQAMPLQQPHPDILSLPLSGSTDDIRAAAAAGYFPVSPSWLPDAELARHWPAIVAGATGAARRACPTQWHIARSIFVCNDPKQAEDYVCAPQSPYRRYYENLVVRTGIQANIDQLLNHMVIRGCAALVSERLLAMQEQTGQIGTLMYLDHRWADRHLARNSLIQMAEKVMPAVNAAQRNNVRELENT